MDFVEHKLIQGQGAGIYLPFARRKVAALYDRAKDMGVTALVQRWRLEGGMVEIAVRVVEDQRYIHIRRKSCPPFLSGLCDLVLHKAGDVVGPDVPVTPIYQVPDPDAPDETINVFRRFYPSLATPVEDRAWRDEPGLAIDEEAAKQMISLAASMFSGEMRKVVQVLQGMNVFIPYSQTYATTHGVFKASSGQRWIIEISNQGICAWPMTMCRNPIRDANNEGVLDYTPIATPKPEDIEAARQAGAYIDLAPASAVLDVYNKSPTYSGCGWAFSESGHKAANCVYTYIGRPARFFLYQIEIAEVDGRPASAAVALLDEGWVSGPVYNAHPKFPYIGNTIASFDTTPGVVDNVECHAPIFCFFSDETLQIAHYHYAPGTTFTRTDESIPCYAGLSTGTLPSDDGAPYITAGNAVYGPTPYLSFGEWTSPSFSHGGGVTYKSRYRGSPRGFTVSDTSNCISDLTDQGVLYVDYTAVTETYTGSGVVRAVVIIPPQDREAIYLCRVTDSTPVFRTFYEILSGLMPHQTGNTGGIGHSLTSIQYLLSPDGCCNTVLGPRPVTLNVGGPDTAGGDVLTCDNGTWVYTGDNSIAVERNIYPGSEGSNLVIRDDGSCECVGNPPAKTNCIGPEVPAVYSFRDLTQTPTGRLDIEIIFATTGSPGRSLPVPDNWADIFEFTEFSPQVIVAIQDAFRDSAYIISPTVNRPLGIDAITNALDYPASEAGNLYRLIGVP
ncbi:hypothetical protein BH20PSE1_BH20PSE1_00940 [soil metagenome]